ncbi:MAG: nucleotide exchange factor GrpE [Candidatus Levybacteria bacterium RIFCSPLOWO2_02_FULL_36_8b]|nr:MAG: nucleotide exchange factor GrpE [Candidatus Levybacteria bacterium RIFCSPLOWO2_02_FULL_36_8b]
MQNNNAKVKGEQKETNKKDEKDLKIEELENQNKRVLADYRNLENRAGQERGEWILKANKQLLLNILPVLDTLIQASKHSGNESLTLSLQQFAGILEKEGVRKIETLGKNFDPNLMEGIQTIEGEDGKVIEELRTGYMLYDKVLRPAQVSVGKGK